MTKMSGPEKPTEQPRSAPGVRCAKCGHDNAHRRNVCENCGAHLYVVCHSCGHRNERSRTHCLECTHKLHRSLTAKISRGLFGTDKRLVQLVLLLLAILLGLGLIVFFSQMRVPVLP